MRYLLAIILINLLSKLFVYSYAENIPEEKFYSILEEAKVFYKGIDNESDCVWDYNTFGSEWFNKRNQQYKFKDTVFYSLGCIYGMYNYWSIWMKEDADGSLIPLTFAYPFYIPGNVDGQEDPSQMLGMSSTRLVCNPIVDEEKMTITTKCLGRGIGDYFSSGTWQYIGQKDYGEYFDIKEDFLLIKFESDLMDDMKEKPVTLYEINSIKADLSSLITTWDNSRNICETSTDETQKSNHCGIMEEASKALDSKGFCKGMHTLRFEEDPSKDDPALKDEYVIFEKLTRNRWFPCVHGILLEDKSQAIYTNFWEMSLEELQIFNNWLIQKEDGTFDIDINKLILKNKWADQNCRGGGADESFFWGQCGIRNSHSVIFEEYGICHGGYNNPPHLMNILGSYIWPFRNKFVPCVYKDLAHDDDIN